MIEGGREKSLRFSRSLRDTVLHTLHLQQTAGDPRRSLSSRLLSTLPLPFSPPASLFCLCPVSLSLFLPAIVRQYLRLVRPYEPRFPTKDALRSTISEKRTRRTASAMNSLTPPQTIQERSLLNYPLFRLLPLATPNL